MAEYRVVGYYDVNAGSVFRFNCDVYSSGIKLTSDERYKENIKPLKSSLSLLQKLGGVSYDLKNPESLNAKKTGASMKKNSGNMTEKEARDVAFFEQWENEQINGKNKRMGFVAQELKTVFPELVEEGKDGLMLVDYMGLIPVIVESIKEQQQIITAQSDKIKELEETIDKLSGNTKLRSDVTDNTSTGLSSMSGINVNNAFLYQNAPNPFRERTEIRYFLPSDVQSAEIYVFNMQGSLIKRLPAGSVGYVEIRSADLTPGMYLYTLVVNGKEVDTKRMILTK